MQKKVVILGSTGSIGTQTLDVLSQWEERYHVTGLSCGNNSGLLCRQVETFQPEHICIPESGEVPCELEGRQIHRGVPGLIEMATLPEVDVVVVSTVGAVGLRPTLEAIRLGKHVALANKEVLVMAGQLMMGEANANGATLLPIDSEHSAIMQCLVSGRQHEVRRIIITASGGPYRDCSWEQMEKTTVSEALNHPTWNMGPKITIDSATMMNKGLEVIECYHLFGVPLEQIEVVVHPQSVVHSMVEFVDGSVIAQLASTDMRMPIQYALSFPDRLPATTDFLDFAKVSQLTFEAPDFDRFPCLRLAYDSLRMGGTAPAVLSVANEIAVQAFLKEKIRFVDIPLVIEKAMDEHQPINQPDIDIILELESEVRKKLTEELL